MTDKRHYIIDSDVLITAKNLYYAFDLCPGFWKSLIHYHHEGRLFSIDRVRSELLAGRGRLASSRSITRTASSRVERPASRSPKASPTAVPPVP